MYSIVCGGNIKTGKESKIAKIISHELCCGGLFNGTIPLSLAGVDMTIWMPNIPNEEKKNYPIKDKGSVLICSKVMRSGYTDVDAVTRIFKMQGNAVIKIYTDDLFNVKFQLTDALGNNWCEVTNDISELCASIEALYVWTKSSIRKSLAYSSDIVVFNMEEEFIKLNEYLADKVAEGCGNRFFGNYSTRCTKLFPSKRCEGFIFSARNTDKKHITKDDLVFCTETNYYGDKKPSVDTPVQIEIYKGFPTINYMIHGHAYIKGASLTDHYFPCGDLREVGEIIKLLKQKRQLINLKHHGFLMVGRTLHDMQVHVDRNEFMSLQ